MNRHGMKIMYRIHGPSEAMMNGAAENLVMIISMIRALLKNQGFKTGTDEPIVHSSDRHHSNFIKFRYSKELGLGNFEIVCSDVRVECRYNPKDNGKIVLELT